MFVSSVSPPVKGDATVSSRSTSNQRQSGSSETSVVESVWTLTSTELVFSVARRGND